MTFEESSERIHLLIDAMTKAKELGDAIFGAFRLLLDGISRQAFANVGSAAGNVVNDPVHEWHRSLPLNQAIFLGMLPFGVI